MRSCTKCEAPQHHAKGLCQNCYRKEGRKVGRNALAALNAHVAEDVGTYDDEWSRFKEYIGIYKPRKVGKIPQGKPESFLLISDLHIPFHNEKAILEAIEVGKGLQCGTVIVGGDALDCYSLSRFIHYKPVPIQKEFIAARLVFDILSRSFEKVIVLTGNHEARERKHFLKKLTSDEAEWLLSKCILERVTEDMPNVHLVREEFYETEVMWFTMIGDCLIGHPEKSSSVPGAPPVKFKQWIDDWHLALNLSRPRVIFMGHTHQFSANFIGNAYVSEIGCLCKIQEYALGPTLYSRPQRLGYVTFEQVDGITQIASIKHFFPFSDDIRGPSTLSA